MMVTNALAGDVGLCLSGLLWIISLWRVVFHLLCCKEHQNSPYITPRRLFHALLWIAMSLELVAYADVAGLMPLTSNPDYATRLGYVLLEVIGRAIFEFGAFSIITILWFNTAQDLTNEGTSSRSLGSLPRVLIGVGLVLAITSIWEAFDMWTSLSDGSWVFRGHIFVEGISWGIQAFVAVICAWLTAQRILRLSTLPQSNTWTRIALLSKPLVPMITCAICYFVRAVWLLHLFMTLPKTSSLANRYGLAWWVGFVWIPTYVPSCMLLYSARKRDPTRDQEQDQDRLDLPLLPTPVPPAEAFISFRRFRDNHDLFSPLTDVDPRAEDSRLFDPPEGDKDLTEGRELDFTEDN